MDNIRDLRDVCDQLAALTWKTSVIALAVEGIEARAEHSEVEPVAIAGLRLDALDAWRLAQDITAAAHTLNEAQRESAQPTKGA